jgi:hypothetical protein
MLPAFMHGDVARDCVRLGKHIATASYVSQDMKDLDVEAKQKNLIVIKRMWFRSRYRSCFSDESDSRDTR